MSHVIVVFVLANESKYLEQVQFVLSAATDKAPQLSSEPSSWDILSTSESPPRKYV